MVSGMDDNQGKTAPRTIDVFGSWSRGEVWFESFVPTDRPWGDDELLDPLPENALGGLGVKTAQYATLNEVRYEPGQYILVDEMDDFRQLLGEVTKIEGLIFPGYSRLVPNSLGMPVVERVDRERYRKRVSTSWLKAFVITGGLVALAFSYPAFTMIGLIGAMMFGLFPLVEATMAWFRPVDRYSIDQLNEQLVNDELFRRWLGKRPTNLVKVAVGVLAVIFVGQMVIDGPSASEGYSVSLLEAALVRNAVLENREWWRLLTTGLMHGSILHILFNGMALFSLGRVIVALVSPALLSIVFLFSVLTGSLASLWYGQAPVSVGASGGLLGCLAFLLVVTKKFNRELPGFLQSSLIQSTIVVSIFGALGAKFIDNAAHAGGFLGGLLIGMLGYQWLRLSPVQTGPVTRILGWICNLILLVGVVKVGWVLWQA